MTSTRAVIAVVFVLTTVLTTQAIVEQGAPATPQPPAAPAGAGERGQAPTAAPGQGRGGGGRGNPAATLYTERCAREHYRYEPGPAGRSPTPGSRTR